MGLFLYSSFFDPVIATSTGKCEGRATQDAVAEECNDVAICRLFNALGNERIITMKLWPYVLGAWLVLTGLNSVISLNFQYEKMVLGVLALVAGVLVILRK